MHGQRARTSGPEKAAAEAEAQREIDALIATCAALETAVAERSRALETARRQVERAAAEVLLDAIDVEQLMRDAEAAQATVIGQHAVLAFLSSALLGNSPERKAIAEFNGRSWLHADFANWPRLPAVAPFRVLAEALRTDPDAKLAEG